MALAKMSWDELNQLVGYKVSLPYDKYFEPMRISKTQKRKRIQMAEKLEEIFVWMLAELFYAEQYGTRVDPELYERIRQEYEAIVSDAVDYDNYLDEHIQLLVVNLVEVLERHKDEEYYYSHDRAKAVSESEANVIFNHTEYEDAAKNKRYKTWNTIMDGRERDSHHDINGTTIPIDDLFILPGGVMAYPKDLTYDPDPNEYQNCRCSLSFS